MRHAVFTPMKLDYTASISGGHVLRTRSLREMVRDLRHRNLIDTEGYGASQILLMHRSLQLNLLHRMDEDEAVVQQTFDLVVDLTRRKFPRQSPVQFPQNDIWEKCKTYSTQVMSVLSMHNASLHPPHCSIDYALLLSDVSNYLWERNSFRDALRTSNAAYEASKSFVGSHEAIRANIHTICGAVRDSFGISERSRASYHYEMAVALRQQDLNKRQPVDVTTDDIWNYANAWGNMSIVLLDCGAYEDAILYAELAIKIKTKLLGPGTYLAMFASYEQNRNKHLAFAALGRHEEASTWEADSLDCITDPKYRAIMLQYFFVHANIALVTGKLSSAFDTLQKVLRMRTDLFGPTDRATLDTYYLIAMVELKRNNPEAARSETLIFHCFMLRFRYLRNYRTYLEKALQNPDEWAPEACARAKYRLAQILLLLKQDSGAQSLLTEASKVRATYWETYASDWPATEPLPDEDTMYDYIVSAGSGRSHIRDSLPNLTVTPKLNGVYGQLLARLGTDQEIMSPEELAHALHTDFTIPVRNTEVKGLI